MKQLQLIGIALVLACSAHVARTQTGLTKEQVQAETKQAKKDGDFIVNEEGQKANELTPNRYPKKAPVTPPKTRSQVKQETREARARGEIPEGDLGTLPRETNPRRYPPQAPAPGLTRAKVKADTLAATRAGDVQIGEDGRTQAEKDPARYAGSPAKPPKLKFKRHSQRQEKSASGSSD